MTDSIRILSEVADMIGSTFATPTPTDTPVVQSPLLTLDGLGVSLPSVDGPFDVLADVDLTVGRGEIIGIAGESGSGKSMTGRALLNLLPDGASTRGTIEFDGTTLSSLDRKGWQKLRGGEIAMVFQDPTAALHPMLTVGSQLTEHMRVHLGLSKSAAKARAVELLDQVRIPDPKNALKNYPHQFSGGMRQRIAIAIALAAEPKLVIADEPTTALDVTVQAGILQLFHRLSSEMDLSVMFITHDLGVLAALAERTYVFYAGRVLETAPTEELLRNPRHPYTSALLKARPETSDVDGVRSELTPIKGQPVTASTAPEGCPFAPRCDDAQDACTGLVPALVRVPIIEDLDMPSTRHLAACVVHSPAGAVSKES
ncbi:ABC transporter ATP-binding protein [Rhodococcoides yunnanense]|uniref:ABC transporter ATP-binding protein n=1 Tax=Rhodococcoides yunnanense TaxID=278209 RepID=UPI001C3FA87E|nr:ABC transporter ATP-binding protein [Rhodococcus yunnanensis]